MLVLIRKENESINIGSNICITVEEINSGGTLREFLPDKKRVFGKKKWLTMESFVRLKIEAPKDLRIDRVAKKKPTCFKTENKGV